MKEYILMIGWIVFACFIFEQVALKKKFTSLNEKYLSKQKIIQAIVYFIPIFILMAFRHVSVGADTPTYRYFFLGAKNQNWSEIFAQGSKDWGYYSFQKILSEFFKDPQWLLIACAAICVLGYMFFFAKTSKNVFLCTLGYLAFGLFAFNLSALRQSIAMVICLLAMKQIEKKSFIKFFLIVAIAFTFHASAIFFLPAYFVGIKKNKKYDVALFSFIGLVVGAFFEPLNKLLFSNIADYDRYGVESSGNGYVFALVMVCILVFTEISKKKILETDPSKLVYINLNYMATALWIVRLFTRTAERPFLYFLPATIICYSIIPENLGKKDKKLISVAMVVLTIALFFYRFKGMPYRFC